MQIKVVGLGIELSEVLRNRISDSVTHSVEKYSNRPGDAHIAVRKNSHLFEVNCSVHLSTGAIMHVHGTGSDAYSACEVMVEKLEKKLRRYKRKLKNHNNTQKDHLPAEETYFYVIESQASHVDSDLSEEVDHESEDETEKAPAIIAEHPGELRTLTVGMAVQEMDLMDAPALVFRNASHGGLNVVMRRADGHISWIDPDRSKL